MDKKSLTFIRKQFAPGTEGVTQVRTYYVNADKELTFLSNERSAVMPETDYLSHLALAKKGLAGRVGKTLHELRFSSQEDPEGHELLDRLKDSALKDDEAAEQMCKLITAGMSYEGDFIITFLYGAADLVSRTADGLPGDSEFVYDYVLTEICPVTTMSPGLCFMPDKGGVHEAQTFRKVNAPAYTFLYPLLDGMLPDADRVLFYSKKPSALDPGLIGDVLGCSVPVDATTQKEVMGNLIEETLEGGCTFDTMRSIHESLAEAANDPDGEPPMGRDDMARVIAAAGADADTVRKFCRGFVHDFGEYGEVLPGNLIDPKKIRIRSDGIDISVAADEMHRVSVEKDRGRKRLVFELDSYTVDDIQAY